MHRGFSWCALLKNLNKSHAVNPFVASMIHRTVSEKHWKPTKGESSGRMARQRGTGSIFCCELIGLLRIDFITRVQDLASWKRGSREILLVNWPSNHIKSLSQLWQETLIHWYDHPSLRICTDNIRYCLFLATFYWEVSGHNWNASNGTQDTHRQQLDSTSEIIYWHSNSFLFAESDWRLFNFPIPDHSCSCTVRTFRIGWRWAPYSSDEDLLRGCCPTEEKAEMQKTCTISHCQELVVVAEQSAWRSLQQHQDAAKEKITEEETNIAVESTLIATTW